MSPHNDTKYGNNSSVILNELILFIPIHYMVVGLKIC